ncbi:plasmid maintenance protein [Borrelia sp. RT5S]|uniref:plasmid maintenance protein n=1 Tax=Borrelia sp. RT5S TaxID=2898581 RepID=UPI001E462DB0|nr:plasmid maintenance protein [Borrelia sp. RT5S]UGQ16703.1 plasmid maintenance protein [Borrelia sp. RT5S]
MITDHRKKYNTKPTPNKKKREDLLLNRLMKLNESKDAASCGKIKVFQVQDIIKRKSYRGDRLHKIYWTVNAKNKQYKHLNQRYSASDIYLICMDLLERDGQKKVSKRTIQNDIKLLNQMGLLKTVTIRFGVDKGSTSFYMQNMELASKYKQIIDTYLEKQLIEGLKDKIIIGDFDEHIASVKFDQNPFDTDQAINVDESTISLNEVVSKVISEVAGKVANEVISEVAGEVITPEEINMRVAKEKKEKKSRKLKASLETKSNKSDKKQKEGIKQQQAISHGRVSDPMKPNNNYSKNSIEVNKEKRLEKVNTTQVKRGRVVSRLAVEYKISSRYMNEISKHCINEATYINAMLNLETALKQYEKEYSIKDIASNFKEQFISRYKRKIWMMMKRKDEVVSDYHIIWELRFKDKYKAKNSESKREGKAIEVNKETRSIIFSVLIDSLERGPYRKCFPNLASSDLRKTVRLYMNSLGDKLSYKGILNNSYYYNILDRLKKNYTPRGACGGFVTPKESITHQRSNIFVNKGFKSSTLREVR